MKPSYDPNLYRMLKEKYDFAKALMNDVATNQCEARKLSKSFKKDETGYLQVRHIISKNRNRLRRMNKEINRYYKFCDKYTELRRFGHYT